MAIYPRATFREVPRFRTSMKPARVNFHTAVSNSSSLYSYFAPDGRVCSHFYVAKDGSVEQYVDTKYRAAADLQGNPNTISIESWDGYPTTYTTAATVIPWTDAQVNALALLLAWIWETHPTIPRRLATTSKADESSHGVSWHRLGVPATYAQLNAGISQTGGLLYSKAVGKTCPGDKRIAQIPTIAKMAAAAGGIGGGTSVVLPAPLPTYSTEYVKEIQTLLNELGEDLLVDGDLGPLTIAAVKRFQTAAGLVVDGDPGPITLAALRTATQEETMAWLVKDPAHDEVYMTDGATKWHVPSPAALAAIQKVTGLKVSDMAQDVIDMIPTLPKPLTAEQVRAAVADAVSGLTADVDEAEIVSGITAALVDGLSFTGTIKAGE